MNAASCCMMHDFFLISCADVRKTAIVLSNSTPGYRYIPTVAMTAFKGNLLGAAADCTVSVGIDCYRHVLCLLSSARRHGLCIFSAQIVSQTTKLNSVIVILAETQSC